MEIQFHSALLSSPWFWLLFLPFLFRLLYVRLAAARHQADDKSIGSRPIPQPRSLPLLKNLLQIDLREPLTSVNELAKKYRDCFRLELPGGTSLVLINSYRLYDEICDHKRFHKEPTGALYEARCGGGDGLFTAFTDEENWGIAHRVLSPYFGQTEVKEVFDEMYKMTQVMVGQWSKFDPQHAFDPYDEFSKFALDVVAKCCFDLDLNSLQKEEVPEFADAMGFFLSESGKRAIRPSLINRYLLRARDRQYWKTIGIVQAPAKEAIAKRKSNQKKKNDMMNAMLYETDPITGKIMTEKSTMQNTFSILGAGIETVASTLSWTLILLLQNPRCLAKLQQEVDSTLGRGGGSSRRLSRDDLDRLPYLTACLRESLRICPVSYAHNVRLRQEAAADPSDPGLGREGYRVKRSDTIRVNLVAIHRDPSVYGADADKFRPERMLDEEFRALPKNAWKPFGTGVRICTGRYFAWQEVQIAIATLIQNFDFELVDDRCRCVVGDTLILKPVDCSLRLKKRIV